MTQVLDRPETVAEPRRTSQSDRCHIAADPTLRRTYCGLIIDEGPCCSPPTFPDCGRPGCEECAMLNNAVYN